VLLLYLQEFLIPTEEWQCDSVPSPRSSCLLHRSKLSTLLFGRRLLYHYCLGCSHE